MKTKTYTITMITGKEGVTLKRQNDGFNPFELLGIVDSIHSDIMKQLRDDTDAKIDIVKREVIKD